MLAEPDRAVCYTKAAIALHNFLRTEESSTYCPPGFVDAEDGTGNAISGSWRHSDQDPSTGLTSISHLVTGWCYSFKFIFDITSLNTCRYSKSASDVRDAFKDYFNSSSGEVCWQYNHVRRTS